MSEHLECKLKKSEWLELYPYGVALSVDQSLPIMIFKDESEKHVLSVPMSAVDVGVAVSQTQLSARKGDPHKLTHIMLDKLGIELQSCYFTEILGAQQMAELKYKGSPKLKELSLPASDALSYCLSTNCKFYSTKKHIKDSRELQVEFSVNQKKKSGLIRNRHPYLN